MNINRSITVLLVIPFLLTMASSSAGQDTKEIYMEGLDNLRFSVEEITVSPGRQVEVTLKTISTLPKEQMAHNFVLLKKKTDVTAFANESLKHKESGYIAPDMEDRIIVRTEMLGDGETDTVTFKAPSEPGEYEYICTFPGHYHAGMKGVLIVK